MVVVDVLLGLNFLVLAACAVRGRSERRAPLAGARFPHPHPSALWQAVDPERHDAVIIPFRPRVHPPAVQQAMALHPSALAIPPGEH